MVIDISFESTIHRMLFNVYSSNSFLILCRLVKHLSYCIFIERPTPAYWSNQLSSFNDKIFIVMNMNLYSFQISIFVSLWNIMDTSLNHFLLLIKVNLFSFPIIIFLFHHYKLAFCLLKYLSLNNFTSLS